MKTETLIYGLRNGETERYTEVLLYDGGLLLNPAQIEKVKTAASKDGFHSFRTTTFNPGNAPDFAGTIQL